MSVSLHGQQFRSCFIDLQAVLNLWTFEANLEDGHAFVWATFSVCIMLQSALRLMVGSRAAVKIVSLLFDIIAVVGSLKEFLIPQDAAIRDPITGFSSHAQFHLSLAAGYFAWAAVCTLLYTRSALAFLHHTLCCAFFVVGLRPFLHHVACLSLFFQSSTFVLDLHALLDALLGDIDSSWLDRFLWHLHDVAFFIVRVAIGLPMSIYLLYSLLEELAVEQNFHSKYLILFATCVMVFLNGLSIHCMFTDALTCFSCQPCAKRLRSLSVLSTIAEEVPSQSQSRQQGFDFKVHIPISVVSHLSTRKFRLHITYGFLSAVFCMIVALILSVAAQYLYCLPDAIPVSNFRSVVYGDFKRNLTASLVQHARSMVDELSMSGVSLQLQGDIDVVISGGGFRGQYAGGVVGVLMLLEERGLLRIRRWSGTSIGALTAAAFATGSSFETFTPFVRVPYGWKAVWQPKRFWEGQPIIREMMSSVIYQENAHELASNKLFIHLTHFDPFPRSRVISEFPSKQMLFDALAASSSVPGFSGDPFFTRFEGILSIDGGVTRNLPIFLDGERPQLVVNLAFVRLSALYTFSPLDPNPEELVRKGIDDVVKMLRGEDVRPLSVIPASERRYEGKLGKFPSIHHLLLYDMLIWGLYAFGPILLGPMLTCIALIVSIVEYRRIPIDSTKKEQ